MAWADLSGKVDWPGPGVVLAQIDAPDGYTYYIQMNDWDFEALRAAFQQPKVGACP